jgi:hypothetical protein
MRVNAGIVGLLMGVVSGVRGWEFTVGLRTTSGTSNRACTAFSGTASQWTVNADGGCIVSLYTRGTPSCGPDNLIITGDDDEENEPFEGGSKVIGFYDVTACGSASDEEED